MFQLSGFYCNRVTVGVGSSLKVHREHAHCRLWFRLVADVETHSSAPQAAKESTARTSPAKTCRRSQESNRHILKERERERERDRDREREREKKARERDLEKGRETGRERERELQEGDRIRTIFSPVLKISPEP